MSLSLIQTNVTGFHEIPSRRRQLTRGQFDALSCVFIGPTRLKDTFIPALDSSSTVSGLPYPLMLVTGVADVEKPGSLTEITISYRGSMQVNGFPSPPTISQRQVETAGSYQISGTEVVNVGTPIGFLMDGTGRYPLVVNGQWVPIKWQGAIKKIGTWTYNVRYLSKQCIIKYQSLSRPSSPLKSSIGTPLAQYTTLSIDRSALSGTTQVDGLPVNVSVTASYTFSVICSDFSVDQVAASLFDCSETWEWKYISSVVWLP